MKIIIIALATVLCTVLSAPVSREVVVDASTSIGGPGGDGGDASVIGAIVEGGFGGDGIVGSDGVVNFGIIEGGDGILTATVGNGAVGTVIGDGSITGSVTNTAIAGDGGAGGAALS